MVRGIDELNSQDSEDYSIPTVSESEKLLEAYENGEILRQEYLDTLRKKEGNPQEVPPRRNIPTLQVNYLLLTMYHTKRILSRIIYQIRPS